MKCVNNQTLYVCESMAGFYIGTLDTHGQPFCRITNYYRSRVSAAKELKEGTFKVSQRMENYYCGGGRCVYGIQVSQTEGGELK